MFIVNNIYIVLWFAQEFTRVDWNLEQIFATECVLLQNWSFIKQNWGSGGQLFLLATQVSRGHIRDCRGFFSGVHFRSTVIHVQSIWHIYWTLRIFCRWSEHWRGLNIDSVSFWHFDSSRAHVTVKFLHFYLMLNIADVFARENFRQSSGGCSGIFEGF